MYKIISLITCSTLILAILLNLNWLHSSYLGVILSLAYLIIFGYLLGKLVFPSFEKSWQCLMGTFSLICSYSLLGAFVYYFYRLDQLVVSILLTVISVVILYLYFPKFQNFRSQLSDLSSQIKATSYNFIKPNITSYNIVLTFTYLLLFSVATVLLFSCQTTEAIKSTWQVIPKSFFLIYFLASLNLLLLLIKSQATSYNIIQHNKTSYNLFLISLHFFLTTSVALIIYKLGYGFDPFIHQATESAIFKQGFILPKPLYYLGQYSIVIILSHLFQISTDWIDKLLLPILLSVFLPYTIYTSLTKAFHWAKNQALTLSLIFLILPFELFIVTNPQALANLLAIIILFLSFLYLKDKQIPFWFLVFLTLITLAIHALAGIPILIYLILIYLTSHNGKASRVITPIFSIVAACILPVALYINSLVSSYKVQFNWQSFDLISCPTIFSKQFNYFLDLAYLYKNSIHWLILILALITFVILIRRKITSYFIPSLLTFFILIANAIFLNFTNVSMIINYEQGEFSERVWQLAFYFLLPTCCYGIYLVLEKIELKPFIYKFAFISAFSIAITASLYLSYPRFDDYDNSKFINVSAADFDALNFIEKNSAGKPYIVITNQSTSAAALKTFGFTRYYHGHYFYPIPTGGELYKYYESMIYEKASKETMIKAMDLADVDIAYFVLPFYWSRFETISKQAEASADAVYNLGNKVMVFKYYK
ncbi:MAG: hypothetical protein NTZ49_04540 [Candidatus Parcubacteria bacterium]|nr:hypothetical protein [Candidatus Parcubacteria bacterium]